MNAKTKKLLEQIIRKEIKDYLSVLLPMVVAEVVDFKLKMLVEQNQLQNKTAKKLTESTVEEWPTLGGHGKVFDKSSLAEVLGYSDVRSRAENRGELKITKPATFTTVTEHGTPVEVSADSLPDHVVNALTKDYSAVMKAMEAKKRL